MVSDPTYSGDSDGSAIVDFSIAIDPGLGRLLVVMNKFTQTSSINVFGYSAHYGVLGLLAMIGFWIVAILFETVVAERRYPTINALASTVVFVITVALL